MKHTEDVAAVVRYGSSVADDSELRLCQNVTGKRVIELGTGTTSNSIALATGGARVMAIDPSAERIAALRRQAEEAEIAVQTHQSEVADLGFLASASVDLVIASHSLHDADDLARLLRQIHRVLKPEAAFIIADTHPIAAMLARVGGQQVVQHAYGSGASRTISDLFMALQRTNFRIDVIHELMPLNTRTPMAPAVLVVRAKKLGV